MERQIEQTPNKIEISQRVCDIVRNEVLLQGLYYAVPPHKYEYYEGGSPTMLELSPEAAGYLQIFLKPEEKLQIGADLEAVLPQVISKSEIGLDPENLRKTEEGLLNIASIPQKVLRSEEVLNFLGELLSENDLKKLEFEYFDRTIDYLTPASLMRADLLLTSTGKALSCDPNLVPLGYTISGELATAVEKQTGIPVAPSMDYIAGISKMIEDRRDNISGVVTTLTYPNWNSHQALAKEVRDFDPEAQFFVIPHQFIDSNGKVDISGLNDFNRAFGTPEVPNHINSEPSVLIKYCREPFEKAEETNIINAPGIRLLETQLWGGLLALDGFSECFSNFGVSESEVCSALSVTTPTFVTRMNGGEVEVATKIHRSDGKISLVFEKMNDRKDLLLGALWDIRFDEKAKDLAWFVKTLSTSGKKGVRFTADGGLDKASQNIAKIAQDKMNLNGIFLVQPKIRSVIGSGESQLRTKIDFFLSFNTGNAVHIDYMATPMSQRSAHGSAATRLGFVT